MLFLNRQKAPWMGRWNGVGGKLDQGESAHDCIVRETKEETGLELPQYKPHGVLRWVRDGQDLGGVYLFTAEVSEEVMASYKTPISYCHEGILDWKTLDWLLHPENTGVVDNIKIILKSLFSAPPSSTWIATYEGHKLTSCEYVDTASNTTE